jgi:glycosyltransferase involved in cell wall biosynthesis
MNVLWFSWKDIKHPQAGGAESLSWQIMLHMVKDGHNVRLITTCYENSAERESVEGVEIFRTGNRYSVYLKACRLYKLKMAGWPDLVIDEMNTIPFASAYYSHHKNILVNYQLAREVWFYQVAFPLSLVGYLLEPLYLRLLARKYPLVLTESESTRKDLSQHGFNEDNVRIFRSGIDLTPIDKLAEKRDMNHVLVLGSVRPMKRTLSAIKGFEFARDKNHDLRLTVAGDTKGGYGTKVKKYAQSSRHSKGIEILGRVSSKKRLELMHDASVIVATSIKEGWGLIVTEANSQGTPAIAYDVTGLRDSIKDSKTGKLVESGNELALGQAIYELLGNKDTYEKLRQAALVDSRQYSFDNSYGDFMKAVNTLF